MITLITRAPNEWSAYLPSMTLRSMPTGAIDLWAPALRVPVKALPSRYRLASTLTRSRPDSAGEESVA